MRKFPTCEHGNCFKISTRNICTCILKGPKVEAGRPTTSCLAVLQS